MESSAYSSNHDTQNYDQQQYSQQPQSTTYDQTGYQSQPPNQYSAEVNLTYQNNNSGTGSRPVQFPPPPPPQYHQSNQSYAPQFQQAPYHQQQQQQQGGYNSPAKFPLRNNGGAMPGQGYNESMPGFQVNNNNNQIPPMMIQPQVINSEMWRTGLCDCFDDPMNALVTFFCPCITFGQVAEILDHGQTSCATSGMLYGLVLFLLGIPCAVSCSYRTKLRSKFMLLESPAPDCAIHFCCETCALCQEYRELQLRGLDPSIGWQGNVAKVQAGFIQQQANMNPPMNQRMMA